MNLENSSFCGPQRGSVGFLPSCETLWIRVATVTTRLHSDTAVFFPWRLNLRGPLWSARCKGYQLLVASKEYICWQLTICAAWPAACVNTNRNPENRNGSTSLSALDLLLLPPFRNSTLKLNQDDLSQCHYRLFCKCDGRFRMKPSVPIP